MQIGSVKRADVFFFRRQGMWTIWSLTLTDHRHPMFRSDLTAQCVLYAVRYAGLHLDWKGRWLYTKTVFLMRIQSTLLRLWLLCVVSVIVLINQLPAFRTTWGHMRGYSMRNMKLETAIICRDAAIIICVCVRVRVRACVCVFGQHFFSIIKDFRTIVLIFIVIFTTFRPICPPVTFTELRTTPFLEYTWVSRSDSMTHGSIIVGV